MNLEETTKTSFEASYLHFTAELKFSKTRKVKSPTRGTEFAAGIDFYVPEEIESKKEGQDLTRVQSGFLIKPGQNALIPSGIKVSVPKGHALIAFNKSGVAAKKGLQVGACVVDEDYQGEVHIDMHNISDKDVVIESGEKIVQFLLIPIVYGEVTETPIENLYTSESARGEGGFGSTGTK